MGEVYMGKPKAQEIIKKLLYHINEDNVDLLIKETKSLELDEQVIVYLRLIEGSVMYRKLSDVDKNVIRFIDGIPEVVKEFRRVIK